MCEHFGVFIYLPVVSSLQFTSFAVFYLFSNFTFPGWTSGHALFLIKYGNILAFFV